MKVLHLPMEVAGQVAEMCAHMQQYGIEAVGYSWRHNYFGYDHRIIHSDAYEMANALEDAIHYFDIFHYHTGYTLYQDKTDIRIILDAGKKVVMHHHGNDVRLPQRAKRGPNYTNPYVYVGDSQPEEQIKQNLRFFSKHIRTAIVQDVELYEYVRDYYEHVYVLPRVINVTNILPQYVPLDQKVVHIVHAPTSRNFKGTAMITRIVHQLQKEFPITFQLIEKMSRQQAFEAMKQADIVIDQILCGYYGNVSIEGMALGKPAVAYIRPDLKQKIADCPVISANPDTLYEQLKYLIMFPEYRRKKGMEGRKYVEQHHHVANVIHKLITIYKSL